MPPPILCLTGAHGRSRLGRYCITSPTPGAHMPKAIYFAHLHKAGGSSMCRMAEANGLRITPRDAFNCRPYSAKDRRILYNGTLSMQCTTLQNLSQHYDFIANEAGLPDDLCFDEHITYVTVVRSPAARYLSYYLQVAALLRHGYMVPEYYYAHALRKQYGYPKVLQPPPFDAFLNHSSANNGFIDNAMTRFFAGQFARAKRGEPLGEPELQRAMCNLRRFDVVLSLETDFTPAMLGTVLGWQKMARGGTTHNSNEKLASLPSATRSLLDAKTVLDQRLYEFARQLRNTSHAPVNCTPSNALGPLTIDHHGS